LAVDKGQCLKWVKRYTSDGAASPATSAMPPKAEAEHKRPAMGQCGLMALLVGVAD
jgi:hypothetical protein